MACLVAISAGLGACGSGPKLTSVDQHLSTVSSVVSRPYFVFRSTTLDHYYGRLAVAPMGNPDGRRAMTDLSCARVAFNGRIGVCLSSGAGLFGTTRAVIFNSGFQAVGSVPVPGDPNRAQESPDGRYAAVTTFVTGTSYAAAAFATSTDIVDMTRHHIVLELDDVRVTLDSHAFPTSGLNFWGVTFARDDDHFYATMGSSSRTYLIEGSVLKRTATVLRTGVECPSLSPDGTRIAFKKRLPGPAVRWQLSVMDLATLQDHPLAETRSVDDQAYWLNNATVAYGLEQGPDSAPTNGISALTAGGSIPTEMWEVPAAGGGHPTPMIAGAWSAVLVP